MPSANVIQLRRMLSEKFPGVRMHLEEQPPTARFWETGVPAIDDPLHGGLPRGALTEIVAPGKSAGSATLLRHWLYRAAGENQAIALIDGRDSLEVTAIDEAALSRLLWIRCRSAHDALKAADLVLRDGNLSLVLLDLKLNPEIQLRKIPATAWYRFQRLVEETSTVCAVFTPRSMVTPASVKLTLRSRLALPSLEIADVAGHLDIEVVDARQFETAVENTA